MWNAKLDELQTEIKISRRDSNDLRYADDTALMEENEEELKSLLMRVKKESGRSGLKFSIEKTKIMASCPITSWQIDRGKMETVTHFIFLGSKITADGDCSHKIKRRLLLGRWTMTNLDSVLKSRYITLLRKVCWQRYSQSYGFASSHVWMWELDHKEGWAPKNLCFWTVGLEKTLESLLDCKSLGPSLDSKEIKPVNTKGNQPWIFTGRTDAEAEVPILWLRDVKSWLFGKDPDAG